MRSPTLTETDRLKLERATSRAYGEGFGNTSHKSWFWKAKQVTSRATAHQIMAKVCPGYNNFQAEQILLLPPRCKITLAREYSVCLYVEGKLDPKLKKQMKASEFDYDEKINQTRIWWD